MFGPFLICALYFPRLFYASFFDPWAFIFVGSSSEAGHRPPILTAADRTNESNLNPSLCIRASILKLRCDGVSSGKGMSPSRYCIA
jgi:hypothetical protein